MARLRDALMPVLVLSLLLLQYAAVQHVLAHLGLDTHGVWAGSPLSDEERDPGQVPGNCDAPQLHAVIDGTPLLSPLAMPVLGASQAAQGAFLHAVAERTAPRPHSRGPPAVSL